MLIPDSIPDVDSQGNYTPRAEIEFFKRIQKEKNVKKNWYVYWNFHIDKHKTKRDGQVDFIFLSEKGLFVIEAKGGDSYEANGGMHYYYYKKKGRSSDFAQNESALEQAEGNLHSIESYLKNKIPNTDLNTKKRVFGYGAALPFIDTREIETGIQWNSGTMFGIHNASVEEYLNFLIKHSKEKLKGERNNFTEKEINLIRRAFQENLKSVPKNLLSSFDEDELINLEGSQEDLAEHFLSGQEKKYLIEGSAGTGKTICAKYFAMKLLEEKKEITWISYNSLFTQEILKWCGNKGNIKVLTAVKFMKDLVRENLGEEIEGVSDNLHEKFKDAAQIEPNSFKTDFLIIDEAQDILSSAFYEGMETYLEGGWDDSSWAIFLDPDLQAEVFKRMDGETLELIRHSADRSETLKINFRNPPVIVEELYKYLELEAPTVKRTFEGELIEKEIKTSLESSLIDIFRKEENPIVLSDCSEKNLIHEIVDNKKLFDESNFKYYLQSMATEQYTKETLRGENLKNAIPIKATSIHSFKGLENEVIILIMNKNKFLNKDENLKSLFYTGLSRVIAKAYLILI